MLYPSPKHRSQSLSKPHAHGRCLTLGHHHLPTELWLNTFQRKQEASLLQDGFVRIFGTLIPTCRLPVHLHRMYTYPFFHENRSSPLADIVERQTGMHRSSSHNRCTDPSSAAPHLGRSGRSNRLGKRPCKARQSNACMPLRLNAHQACRPGL